MFLSCFHFVIIIGLVALAFYAEQSTVEATGCNITCIYKIAWIFPIPYTIFTFLGLLVCNRKSRNGGGDEEGRTILDMETNRTKIHICIVTKGSNVDAIERVTTEMKYLTKLANVVIVTDDNEYTAQLRKRVPSVQLCVTPKTFQTKKAKYKSRALEYFRLQSNFTTKDWILHMDEESVIDEDNFKKCIQFISDNKFQIGQGVILYNAHNYFMNKFLTVLDSIRVSDDYGRFNLQYKLIHRPWFGFHGSFLLLNGEVENEVTWDHEHSDNLKEDFAFAMKCWEKNYACGDIDAIVREVSPNNLKDFVKQRRRWFVGILTLPYWNARALAVLWMLGVITIFCTYFHFIFSIYYSYSTPLWISLLSTFSFVVSIYMYMFGIFRQTMDCCRRDNVVGWKRFWMMIKHLAWTIMFVPLCPFVESVCIVYSLVRKPNGFDVIHKT